MPRISTPLTNEDIDLYRNGMSLSDLAKKLHKGRPVLAKLLQQAGVPLRTKEEQTRFKTALSTDDIQAYVDKRTTLRKLAKKYNVAHHTIADRLVSLGITIRKSTIVNPDWQRYLNRMCSTPKWKEWRKLVLARDNHSCILCTSTNSLHVHHIKMKHLYPELFYNLNNCVTLCSSCHHSIRGKERRFESIFLRYISNRQ